MPFYEGNFLNVVINEGFRIYGEKIAKKYKKEYITKKFMVWI